MKVEIKGNVLVIEIPFDKKGKLSGSGKSLVHATTNGNKETEVEVGGKNLVLGINAYTKK
jgi:hypothetical protein